MQDWGIKTSLSLPVTAQLWRQREGSPPNPLTKTNQSCIYLTLRLHLRWLDEYGQVRGAGEQLALPWFTVPGSTGDPVEPPGGSVWPPAFQAVQYYVTWVYPAIGCLDLLSPGFPLSCVALPAMPHLPA